MVPQYLTQHLMEQITVLIKQLRLKPISTKESPKSKIQLPKDSLFLRVIIFLNILLQVKS